MKPPSDRMYARGFRSLSLPSLGSFRLSLTVLCAIGHRLVFSLGGWAPRLRPGFHVPWATLEPDSCLKSPQGALTRCGHTFQNNYGLLKHDRSGLPRINAVWAHPASLAATKGISVDFFSSGYLDVSVPRVCPPLAEGLRACLRSFLIRVPAGQRLERLAAVFRRCPRPSSPAYA